MMKCKNIPRYMIITSLAKEVMFFGSVGLSVCLSVSLSVCLWTT